MTIHVPKPRGMTQRLVERRDQEFLPAALEILQTPPAPFHTLFLLVICAFMATALVWSYFSRIDIIATAQGKIQPTGRVKLVQPTETGKVVALNANNGLHVRAGDVLVELEAGEAMAEERAISSEYEAALAEIARRKVAMDVGRLHQLGATPTVIWTGAIPTSMKTRETRVLVADITQLDASVTSLLAQIKQKDAERDRLTETVAAQSQLIGVLAERVQMRDTLVTRGAGSKADLIDALETLDTEKTTLATQTGQKKESEANIEVLEDEVRKVFDTFVADNGQKLEDAERRADDAEQKLIKAHVHTAHMTLKSPIDGTIQALSVTTVGQVVTTGEELMRIVPDGSGLEIECYLPNKDAGFVRVGQAAVMKLEAFPFTRYGTMNATVTAVADDAIPEADASLIEGNPAKSNKSMFDGAERTQNLVFPVTLKPQGSKMKVDGLEVPLSSGMAVSVEVRTGSRRILEYVFSPLVEVASRALTER